MIINYLVNMYHYFIPGNTGTVEWSINNYEGFLTLYSPTSEQCEDAMSRLQLIKEDELLIQLYSLSPESMLVIMNNISKASLKGLSIYNTQLDSKCLSKLSEVLFSNVRLEELFIESSSLTGGIKQVSDALVNNVILQELWLDNILLTDEDITHLSDMISVNVRLKSLYLRNCNVTDNGVRYICEGLTKNTTIQELCLSKQHKEYCMKLDSYQVIKDRLRFW